ncbi:hypothetical protein [Vreelandella neptunia]|uniref:DUF5610 domain-containing protein n=1 Tax=Vreelandella neptunia TaxID=115551 RepID=A0ABS9S137_9GAMM|nr:hypothetical protein [Halomonas neptunia]MCH4809821.1 hypothetical protein [Halomonas neptunia]
MKTHSYAFSLLNTNNHYNEKVLGRGTMSASHINSPNYYGFQAGDSPLIEGSSRIASSHSLTKSEEKSAVVNLSSMAMEMSKILLKEEGAATVSPAAFDGFLEKMHEQLQEMVGQEVGKVAEILLERPNSFDKNRLSIAEQAANHLMSKFYNSDEPFPQASSENPFAELDRHSLSKIAFDDSGDFTAAERYLSFLQMTENDTHFRNQAYELYSDTYAAEGDYGGGLTRMARQVDAKLISGMTEAERAWRGVSVAPEENKLAQADNRNLSELPAYTNGVKASLESFFVVEGDENGGVLRSIDIRAVLENEEEGMSLLKMALRSLEQKDSEER